MIGRIEAKVTLLEAKVHNLKAIVDIHVQTTLILEKLEALLKMQKDNKINARASEKEEDNEQQK